MPVVNSIYKVGGLLIPWLREVMVAGNYYAYILDITNAFRCALPIHIILSILSRQIPVNTRAKK